MVYCINIYQHVVFNLISRLWLFLLCLVLWLMTAVQLKGLLAVLLVIDGKVKIDIR